MEIARARAHEASHSRLDTPYGSRIVDLLVPQDEREDLVVRAATLPSIQISDRSLCDLELLAVGAFSPLQGFLARADYDRVLHEMRLADGTLWPIPITLPVADDVPVRLDAEVALRNTRNDLMAILTVEEVFSTDPERESERVLGRFDRRHPLTAEMTGWGRRCLSGRLRVGMPRSRGVATRPPSPADSQFIHSAARSGRGMRSHVRRSRQHHRHERRVS